MAFTSVALTGVVLLANNQPYKGAVVSAQLSQAITDGATFVEPQALNATCDQNGNFSLSVLANDDTTTLPKGTFYNVTISGQNPFQVTVPKANAPSVSLFSLAQLVNPSPASVYVNQIIAGTGISVSPAGGTGIVTVSGLWVAVVGAATATYTVGAADEFKTLDPTAAAFTVNLPAATGSGRYLAWRAINSNTNVVTITPNGSDKIDGAASTTVGPSGSSAVWQALELIDAAAGAWRSM